MRDPLLGKGLTISSSPSDPPMTSSKSIDSLLFWTFPFLFVMPDGDETTGAEFCELTFPATPCLAEEFLRVIPSSCRGWGTLEMEIERKRWSAAARELVLDAVKLALRILAAAFDWKAE